MKNNVYFGVAFRIVLLFTIAILATFVPEHLTDFFGDKMGNIDSNGKFQADEWDWGARHHWYAWMMFFLFMLTLTNLVLSIIKIIKKNYDTSTW